MSDLLARLVVIALAVLPPLGTWLAAISRKRLGWEDMIGKAAWLVVGFLLGLGPIFAQLWVYRRITASRPDQDPLVVATIVIEGLIALGIMFWYLVKYDSNRSAGR